MSVVPTTNVFMKYKLYKTSHNDKSNILEEVLHNRGIENTKEYLNLDKKVLIPYNKLDNIDEAVKCVLKHIEAGNKICILADTDVDGLCSSSMLYSYLKRLTEPHRASQIDFLMHKKPKSHGLASNDVDFPDDMKLLIIPDAGTNDAEECKIFKEKGIDVVILDHHIQDIDNPFAIVVNNQNSKNYSNKDFCGAGVVYKFLQALDEETWNEYADDYLDLCALANISDNMDLRSLETKYIVDMGLKNIKNKFFLTLIDAQNYSMNGIFNIHNIQYYITPILNALIRIGEFDDQVLLFNAFAENFQTFEYNKRKTKSSPAMTIDEDIYSRGARLCKNAKSRQDKLREKSLKTIVDIVEKNNLNKHKIIIVDTTKLLDNSLTGVVAIKVAEHFNLPCILLNRHVEKKLIEKDGKKIEFNEVTYGGSGRNPNHSPIEDLKEIVNSSNSFNFAQGHKSAFGVNIDEENVQFAQKELDDKLKDIIYDTTYYVDFIYDVENPIDITDVRIIDSLKDIYATGIDEVSVVVEDIELKRKDFSLFGQNNDTISFVYNEIKYIQFKCKDDNELYLWLKNGGGDEDIFKFTVVGKPSVNEYNNVKTCQVIIDDFNVLNYTVSEEDDSWGNISLSNLSNIDDFDDDEW